LEAEQQLGRREAALILCCCCLHSHKQRDNRKQDGQECSDYVYSDFEASARINERARVDIMLQRPCLDSAAVVDVRNRATRNRQVMLDSLLAPDGMARGASPSFPIPNFEMRNDALQSQPVKRLEYAFSDQAVVASASRIRCAPTANKKES
jgi:hypothetical protein